MTRPCACCGNRFEPAYEEQMYCGSGCYRTAGEARRLSRGGPAFNPTKHLTVPQLALILEHFLAGLDGFVAELQRDTARAKGRGLLALAHDVADMRDRSADVAEDTRGVLTQLRTQKLTAKGAGE